MNFQYERFDEVTDYRQFYNDLRTNIESLGYNSSERFLLILDIIGVTGKLHCIREIPNRSSVEVVQMIYRHIILTLNYSLMTAEVLQDILENVEFEYMGDKGDRIDIIGDPASVILLSLILKTSEHGKDLRVMVLGNGDDWKHKQEDIQGKRVSNLLLNHDKLDAMNTRDLVSSTQSILLSPSLQSLLIRLIELNILNPFGIPNPSIFPLYSEQIISDRFQSNEFEVAPATTLIVKAGDQKTEVTDYLLDGTDPSNVWVNLDSGRKNLAWITLKGEPLSIVLSNARATFLKFPFSQIFYTSNLALFAKLVNQETLCLDPYATNILSKLLKLHKFNPGVYVFNPKTHNMGFERRSIENHVGIDEAYDHFGIEEG